VTATEEDVREMLGLLDQYRYRVEALTQQLQMLTVTEAELGQAWKFLGSYGDVEDGSEVLVPVGGGIFVSAQATRPDKVTGSVGDGLFVEMDPKDAAEAIGERRDRVREMMQQVRAGIEQTEQSAMALQQQAEAAFQELQEARGARG
jgi:prefoldin alpha subunit